jgi:hypothetical protein
MSQVHEGGCACGAVRYRVKGEPVRTNVCHCTFCQRRTGSAFGIGIFFKEEDIEFEQGELKTYEHHSDESHRWLRLGFCPNCGTTVTWTVEILPGARSIAGGTFDDRDWYKIERHIWTRSAHPWVVIPPGVKVFEQAGVRPPQPVDAPR